MRSIRHSESKFYEAHNKLIERIKARSGLNDEAKDLTVSLLQCKENSQEIIRRIKSQLDKLINELKDTRSKNVLETLHHIQRHSYDSIVKSLTKAKEIDEHISKKFSCERALSRKDDPEHPDECSLIEQLPLNHGECSMNEHAEESDLSRRFEMDEDELSGFN
jgi:hypothetical protein